MATVFKTFLNNDVATTRTLLNEAIPIDGKIMFGSYDEPIDPPNGNTSNVKYFPHEMFQSVYDYPYLKSSSNHIFDITLGASADSLLAFDATTGAAAKKQAIYNQFAQIMVGYDSNGNILKFDEDGNILDGGDKYDEAYLLSVARLLNKDEMKKGSFYLQLDFAIREPAERIYTDPGTPPTWPVAVDPTLTFKQFAEATGCPAGFFECNAGGNAAIELVVTSGDFAEGTDPQFTINSTAVGGPDPSGIGVGVVYFFQNSLTAAPVGDLSPFAVEVLTGTTDTATTLQNLTNAINNTEGLSAGDSGTTYAYGSNWVEDPNVVAVFNGSDTVTVTSVGAVDGTLITARYSAATGNEVGTLGSAGFDLTTTAPEDTTPQNFTLAADTLINSDDYRRISMIITDEGAQNDYRVNSPAGDYGILKIKEYKVEKWDAATNTISDVCVIDAEALQTAADGAPDNISSGGVGGYDRKVGLVYYQAGVVAITPYAFVTFDPTIDPTAAAPNNWSTDGQASLGRLPYHTGDGTPSAANSWWNSTGSTPLPASQPRNQWTSCTEAEILSGSVCGELPDPTAAIGTPGPILIEGLGDVKAAWQEAPIDSSTGGESNATGFRRRMVRMAFNNTTELNSTIYFARLNNNEFNYSANPTYLNESKIRVKETTLDAPVSYITTVGLYSADNELLAQAKLSEPVRKDPTNEFVLRVRLDY